MTHTATDPETVQVHFVADGLTVMIDNSPTGRSAVMEYGSELTINPALREANTDRLGSCPLIDLLDDEDGQIARYGKVMVRRGPWPDGLSRIEPGSEKWEDARETARQAAWKIDDNHDRARALAAVKEKYGPQPTTSHTMADYSNKR